MRIGVAAALVCGMCCALMTAGGGVWSAEGAVRAGTGQEHSGEAPSSVLARAVRSGELPARGALQIGPPADEDTPAPYAADLERPAQPWRYLDSGVRQELARRVHAEAAVAELSGGGLYGRPVLCLIEGLDAPALVRQGLASRVVARRGALYAVIDPAAALLNRRYDLVHRVLECAPRDGAPREWGGMSLGLLERLFTGSGLETAREDLAATIETAGKPYRQYWGGDQGFVMGALLLGIEFGEKERVRDLCRRALREGVHPDFLVGAAQLAGLVLEEKDLARELLVRAESLRPGHGGAAEAWLNLFGDADAARETLALLTAPRENGHGAEEARIWAPFKHFAAAAAWSDLFGDTNRYFEHIEAALAGAESGISWAQRAASDFKRGHASRERASAYLRKSERSATTAADWFSLARLWADLAGDMEAARNAADEARARASSTTDWEACGGIMLEHFDDAAGARECLDAARRSARTAQDWNRCAELAARLGAPEDEVLAYLDRAITQASHSMDWIGVAERHWRIYADLEQSVRFLEKAEQADGFTHALVSIADSYLRLFAKEERAAELAELAERHAANFQDWYWLAAFYLQRAGDAARAREMLAKAETLAGTEREQELCSMLRGQMTTRR